MSERVVRGRMIETSLLNGIGIISGRRVDADTCGVSWRIDGGLGLYC